MGTLDSNAISCQFLTTVISLVDNRWRSPHYFLKVPRFLETSTQKILYSLMQSLVLFSLQFLCINNFQVCYYTITKSLKLCLNKLTFFSNVYSVLISFSRNGFLLFSVNFRLWFLIFLCISVFLTTKFNLFVLQ